jgi:hypothetical protein
MSFSRLINGLLWNICSSFFINFTIFGSIFHYWWNILINDVRVYIYRFCRLGEIKMMPIQYEGVVRRVQEMGFDRFSTRVRKHLWPTGVPDRSVSFREKYLSLEGDDRVYKLVFGMLPDADADDALVRFHVEGPGMVIQGTQYAMELDHTGLRYKRLTPSVRVIKSRLETDLLDEKRRLERIVGVTLP